MEYCPETNLSCEGGKNSGRGTWCDHLGCLTATFTNTLVISIFMIFKCIQICGKNDADAVFILAESLIWVAHIHAEEPLYCTGSISVQSNME